jgi:hypothetical protein
MKIRIGFVSNSSSASFVVSLDKITEKDMGILMSYPQEISAAEVNRAWPDSWSITVDTQRGVIRGYTTMDNGDLSEFLNRRGVDVSLFIWDSF